MWVVCSLATVLVVLLLQQTALQMVQPLLLLLCPALHLWGRQLHTHLLASACLIWTAVAAKMEAMMTLLLVLLLLSITAALRTPARAGSMLLHQVLKGPLPFL